jgi:hypothetical protein
MHFWVLGQLDASLPSDYCNGQYVTGGDNAIRVLCYTNWSKQQGGYNSYLYQYMVTQDELIPDYAPALNATFNDLFYLQFNQYPSSFQGWACLADVAIVRVNDGANLDAPFLAALATLPSLKYLIVGGSATVVSLNDIKATLPHIKAIASLGSRFPEAITAVDATAPPLIGATFFTLNSAIDWTNFTAVSRPNILSFTMEAPRDTIGTLVANNMTLQNWPHLRELHLTQTSSVTGIVPAWMCDLQQCDLSRTAVTCVDSYRDSGGCCNINTLCSDAILDHLYDPTCLDVTLPINSQHNSNCDIEGWLRSRSDCFPGGKGSFNYTTSQTIWLNSLYRCYGSPCAPILGQWKPLVDSRYCQYNAGINAASSLYCAGDRTAAVAYAGSLPYMNALPAINNMTTALNNTVGWPPTVVTILTMNDSVGMSFVAPNNEQPPIILQWISTADGHFYAYNQWSGLDGLSGLWLDGALAWLGDITVALNALVIQNSYLTNQVSISPFMIPSLQLFVADNVTALIPGYVDGTYEFVPTTMEIDSGWLNPIGGMPNLVAVKIAVAATPEWDISTLQQSALPSLRWLEIRSPMVIASAIPSWMCDLPHCYMDSGTTSRSSCCGRTNTVG